MREDLCVQGGGGAGTLRPLIPLPLLNAWLRITHGMGIPI